MIQKTLQKLGSVLKKDERLLADDGKILKNQTVELANKLDENLISLLADDKDLKKIFFKSVGDMTVFDKDKFIEFVSNKEFLPDSYTAFKNKIGFESNGAYLKSQKEVVLVWPYKDCILEGGQTKEDAKRKEIFWNETLAPDDISRLLEAKVLTNWRRYDKDNTKNGHVVKEIKDTDNLIIKGNNLLALHSLKKRFVGKVKLIYIDPPYNTGNDSFGYNDSFNHSTWLTFMKNRLEVARELLSNDGAIFISIDDDESHYLKVICDDIFGRENFVANIVWQKKYSPQNDAKYFSDDHDHILVFAKRKENWKPNLLPRTEEMNARYKNLDNDPRGNWKSSDLSVKTYAKSCDYKITIPSGRIVSPPKGYSWRVNKKKFNELVEDNRIWFGDDGSNVPSIKRFLSDVQDGIVPKTLWLRDDVGDNQEAKKEINALGFGDIFDTPKPERLLHKILGIGSKESDLILDFFAGSGTTLAVAHKTGRQYIGIEQMEYIHDLPESRLKKVIEGEQGGISKAVNWKGGGSFVYTELMPVNERFVREVEKVKNKKEVADLWKRIEKNGFLSYRVDEEKFHKNAKDFSDLSLEEQKKFILESLNKNMLYVPINDIEDSTYKVSKDDIKLNEEFYGE
ncbi:MAG: site-specific DNA-methyltransferase [Parcubacteria group bacterium]